MRKVLQKNLKNFYFQIPSFSLDSENSTVYFNKRYIEFNYNCKITRDIKFHINCERPKLCTRVGFIPNLISYYIEYIVGGENLYSLLL